MRKLAIILFLAVVAHSPAALTLVQRETFQGVGTLNSGTPGNLGTVNFGSFYKRAVGPRVTSDTTANSLGWSADLQITVGGGTDRSRQHTVAIVSTAAVNDGMWTEWRYVVALVASGSNKGDFNRTRQSNGNQIVWVLFKPGTNGNFWTNRGGDWTDRDSGVAIPIMQHFELRHTWHHISGNNYDYTVAYRLAGTSSWVNVISGNYTFAGTIDNIQSGELAESGGSSAYFQGRYGMPSLYSTTSYSADSIAPISDVADPVGPTTWYTNASTGSDANDGVTSGTPWLTVGKINTESQYCGMFPTAGGYANGDTLTIDTSSAPLLLGTATLTIQTRGLNLVQVGGVVGTNEIQAWKSVANASFSLVSGNVYSTADVEQSVVLWENNKWPIHITAATFAGAAVATYANGTTASYANVTAAIQANPGSWWTDGATGYFQPLGGTNPISDGKNYTRSYYRATVSAINLTALDVHLNGIVAGKTCVADKASSDPGVNYVIQGSPGFGGTSLIENCYLYYGSKHILGFTDSSSNSTVTISNVQVEQGTPYSSQNPFVSYNGSSSASGNQHFYVNCTSLAMVGVIGSTAGTNTATGGVFYSHNVSGSNQFSLVSFNGCNFGGPINAGNSVVTLTVDNSTFGGGGVGTTTFTVNRCTVSQQMPYMASTGTMTMRNSVIIPTTQWGAGLNLTHDLNGTEVIENNTFDLTQTTRVTNDGGGLFKHATNATLTFRNNVVKLPNAATFAIFENLTTGDTITATNNVVYAPANVIALAYNDGSTTANRTFAQWQTLGFDANSLNSSNLLLSADYKPLRGSPVINTGVDLGPLVDYTNRLFAVRNDIGAYEFIPALNSLVRRGGLRR